MVASFSDVAQPRLQRQARARPPRSPSSRASRSEPVIALKRPAIVPISSSRSARMTRDRSPLRDARRCPRPGGAAARTTVWRSAKPDGQRDADHDQQKQRERHGARWPRPRRRCSGCRAACPASPPACAPGGRAAAPARRRRRAAPPSRTQRAPDAESNSRPTGAVLDLGGLHQQQPRLVVGLAPRSPHAQHLQLEQLVGLARGADARRAASSERVAFGRRQGSMPARSAVAISRASRPRSASRFGAPHLERRVRPTPRARPRPATSSRRSRGSRASSPSSIAPGRGTAASPCYACYGNSFMAMTADDIRARIRAAMPDAEVTVTRHDRRRRPLRGDRRLGGVRRQGPVDRHRLVYAALGDAMRGADSRPGARHRDARRISTQMRRSSQKETRP